MVCVVNLVSPDGRYDSTYLDNYAQIYVLDVLKRIAGRERRDGVRPQVRHADLARPGPDGRAAHRARARSSTRSRPRTARRPRARSAASRPPPGLVFEYPILTKGRLSTGQGIRGDHRPPPRRRLDRPAPGRRPDRARLGELRHRRLAQRQAGRHAAGLPVLRRQRARHRRAGPREHGPPQAKNFPPGLEYRIAYDTTKYVSENIVEVEETLVRGVPAGPAGRLRVPPGGAGDDHPDAGDPGRAGGDLRDDGRRSASRSTR